MKKLIRRWKKTARRGTPSEKIKLLCDILENDPEERDIWEENLRFCRDALFQEMLSEAENGVTGDILSFFEKVLLLDDPLFFCSALPDGGKVLQKQLLTELHNAESLQDIHILEKGVKIWQDLDFENNDTITGFENRINAYL